MPISPENIEEGRRANAYIKYYESRVSKRNRFIVYLTTILWVFISIGYCAYYWNVFYWNAICLVQLLFGILIVWKLVQDEKTKRLVYFQHMATLQTLRKQYVKEVDLEQKLTGTDSDSGSVIGESRQPTGKEIVMALGILLLIAWMFSHFALPHIQK